MRNSTSTTSTSWEQIPRQPVPSSANLQAAILAATENQAQSANAAPQRRQSSSLTPWFRARLVTSFVALSVLFIATMTMLPSMKLLTEGPESAAQPISLPELELQELALLQDELLFAQL